MEIVKEHWLNESASNDIEVNVTLFKWGHPLFETILLASNARAIHKKGPNRGVPNE